MIWGADCAGFGAIIPRTHPPEAGDFVRCETPPPIPDPIGAVLPAETPTRITTNRGTFLLGYDVDVVATIRAGPGGLELHVPFHIGRGLARLLAGFGVGAERRVQIRQVYPLVVENEPAQESRSAV